MSGKYFGRAFIRANGITLASLSNTAKLNPGGVTRTPVMGDHGFLGWSEQTVASEMECEIGISADTDIIALGKMTDATVTFECDNGKTWVIRNACVANPVSPQAGEGGKAPLKFIGPPAEEV